MAAVELFLVYAMDAFDFMMAWLNLIVTALLMRVIGVNRNPWNFSEESDCWGMPLSPLFKEEGGNGLKVRGVLFCPKFVKQPFNERVKL